MCALQHNDFKPAVYYFVFPICCLQVLLKLYAECSGSMSPGLKSTALAITAAAVLPHNTAGQTAHICPCTGGVSVS